MLQKSIWLALLLLVATAPGFAFAAPPASPRARQSPDQNGQAEKPATTDSDPPQPLDLSDEVVRDVLGNLQRALENRNLNQVLAVFDSAATLGYPHVRDQLAAFLKQYTDIRFRYQLLQVMSEKDHGYATADVDIEASSDYDSHTFRRSSQMRFQMKLGRKGWKLVGFTPAEFFSQ